MKFFVNFENYYSVKNIIGSFSFIVNRVNRLIMYVVVCML